LPDEAFEATASTHRYDVAERTAAGVADMLADFVPRIAMALGVADIHADIGAAEGSEMAGGDPVDESVVAAGLDLRTSIARYRSGDLTLFRPRVGEPRHENRHRSAADPRQRPCRSVVHRTPVAPPDVQGSQRSALGHVRPGSAASSVRP
jgi:hypothetical protein